MAHEREDTPTAVDVSETWNKVSWNSETTVHTIREMIHDEVKDVLYISETVHMPDKKDIGRCYRTDFRLLTNREAKRLCDKNDDLHIGETYVNHQFFVYNERRRELVPFKKKEYLMSEKEYMTYDGTKYVYYDNDGNFKQYMTMKGNTCSYYDKKNELIGQETLLDAIEEDDAETLIKQEHKKKPKK